MRAVAALLALLLLPFATLAAGIPVWDDDAGSGRDAPNTPVATVWVQPGVVYAGTRGGTGLDTADHYAFSGVAGQTIHALSWGSLGQLNVLDASGAPLDSRTPPATAGYALTAEYVAKLPTDGTYYLRISYFTADAYRFSFGLDADAPWPGVGPAVLAPGGAGTLPAVAPATQADEHVVVAVVDTGINPYHEFFRAPALVDHPSTWLTGFPAGAQSVQLDFGQPNLTASVQADAAAWGSLQRSAWLGEAAGFDTHLYTFPGTRIVGAVSFGEYSERLGGVGTVPILDEHGHGTHSAGLAAGANMAAPDGNVLIVMVEVGQGAFEEGVRWAARQPWIDAISASIGTVANAPATTSALGSREGMEWATREAAMAGKPVFMASGNGVSGTGLAPDHCATTTGHYTGPSWVTRIGAAERDSGNPTYWHCVPVEAVARTNVASPEAAALSGGSIATGTSAATPNAAGHWARVMLEARREDIGASRVEALDHLLHAAEPAAAQVGAHDPSTPQTAPLDQGYGLVDDAAVSRALATLRAGAGPTPRPYEDAVLGAERGARDLMWGAVMSGAGGIEVQNDAGSGRDAPAAPGPTAPVLSPGRVYDGMLLGLLLDESDFFGVDAVLGDVLHVEAAGPLACVYVYDPAGVEVDFSCVVGTMLSDLRVPITQTGRWHVEYSYVEAQAYRISVGLAGDAASPLGVGSFLP